MATPIELRVVQAMQTAFRSISIAGGYWHDVASAAVKLDIDANVADLIGANPARPFIVIEATPEDITYPEKYRRTRIATPFIIHFIDDTDPTDDTAMLEKYYKAIADIEKAIIVDDTWGGLANHTTIVNREKHKTAEGQQVWAQVTAEVVVTREYGAPNG